LLLYGVHFDLCFILLLYGVHFDLCFILLLYGVHFDLCFILLLPYTFKFFPFQMHTSLFFWIKHV
jgi:hypothetical protein